MDYGARAREIGAELREIRTQAQFTQGQVGELIGWTKVMVSRTERGLKRLSDTELSTILMKLGAPGAVSDRLLTYARELTLRDWWEGGSPEVSAPLRTVFDYERTAQRITEVGLNLIPQLLQTPDYLRCVLNTTAMDANLVDKQATIAERRQRVLTGKGAVELITILDEAAIRRHVGGRTVMAEQLRHLVRVANRPNVTVQLIPISAGAHPAQESPYELIEFHRIPAVVHFAHHDNTVLVDEATTVQNYRRLTRLVRESAMSPGETRRVLNETADRAERTSARQ